MAKKTALVIFFMLLSSLFVHPVNVDAISEPKEEIQVPLPPLPPIWHLLRKGKWISGVNLPWDNYGTDFGKNAWGDRGLANQGPSGWRRETRGGDGAAKGFFWAHRESADYCLGIEIELKGPLSSALIFSRFDEAAEKPHDATLNLSGQKISVDVYLPSAIAGPNSAPSGVLLFLQDMRWTWAQTSWMNITQANTDRWITLALDVNTLASQYPGFDATQVRTVGVKVGTGGQASGFSYKGPFYIDNVTASAAPEVQHDFSKPDTRTEKEMKDLATLNVNTTRWWLFADGRASLKYDDNGFVTGLTEGFSEDFDEMIRLARSAKVYLMPVLFDFLLGAEARITDGVQEFGRADLINDPDKRQSLIENAISVIFEKVAAINEIVIIDLMNEPEWLLLDSDIVMPLGKRPPEIKVGGVVSLATMKDFFRDIIAVYKQKGLEGKHLLTIGSASSRWVTLWEDLDLDIAQFHLWHGKGQIDEGLSFDFPPPQSGIPTLLGEFSTVPAQTLHTTCEFLRSAQVLGYAGAFPWAYRAKDTASLPLLGKEARNCLASATVPLTVTIVGSGSGKVKFTPPGTECSTTCSQRYPTARNTEVTLTATADTPGSTFVGWSGDSDCTDGQVTANTAKTCVATFQRQTFGVSGRVTTSWGGGIAGVTMTFTGGVPAVQTDLNGNWSQGGFSAESTYRVTPSKAGYFFTPSSRTFSGKNTGLNFTAASSAQYTVPQPFADGLPHFLKLGGGNTSLTFAVPQSRKVVILFNAECSVAAFDDTTWLDIDILVDGVAVPPSNDDNAFCTSTGDGQLQHWVNASTYVAKTVAAGVHTVQVRGTLRGFAPGDQWQIDDLSLIVLGADP